MLLHNEQFWLVAYFLAVVATITGAAVLGVAIWLLALVAIVGTIFAFYGWLFQVGRVG